MADLVMCSGINLKDANYFYCGANATWFVVGNFSDANGTNQGAKTLLKYDAGLLKTVKRCHVYIGTTSNSITGSRYPFFDCGILEANVTVPNVVYNTSEITWGLAIPA